MATKASNPFKASLFGKDAGVTQLQNIFEQSKEKMKTNPARSVLKNTVELAIHTTNNETEFEKQLAEQKIQRLSEEMTADGLRYHFIDNGSRTVWNGSQLDRNLSANLFNEWWNNRKQTRIKDTGQPFC